MKNVKLNLIVAACENMGIGKQGDLPWRLKWVNQFLPIWSFSLSILLSTNSNFRNELKYFSSQTKKVNDPSMKNAVIMGRKTYFGIPESKRPLPLRFNVVLTSEPEKYEFPADVIIAKSMDEALAKINEPGIEEQIENVWIVGGHSVYKEAMESTLCHRVYFTKVMATFDCDAFFPTLSDSFKLVENDPDIPSEIQEEDGIKYQYQIFEKV